MLKRLSVLALAGIISLPAMAGAATNDELEARIDQLTKEFEQKISTLRGQMESRDETLEVLGEKAEGWDLSSRIHLSGDIRSRLDYHQADTAEYYKATDVAMGVVTFTRAQPALAAVAGNFPTVGDMVSALQPALADLDTWRGAAAGLGITESGQQEALFYMFTNPEVGALLTGMAAAPATTVTDAMQTPETLAGFMRNLSPAARAAIFTNMGFGTTPAAEYKNDTLWTNRLRLNLRAKATENVEVKARIVGYKAWGSQDSPMPETNENGIHDTDSPYFLNSRSFDGTVGRQPGDSKLVLDRAFLNWNNIGGQSVWFSIGRRPTTDGPPAHLRMGADGRLATPVAYMDYPFDGFSIGYAYQSFFGLEDWPGRVRFCGGRGFESGPGQEDNLNDVDFGGISWDVYSQGNRFVNIQAFGAFNLFNVPGDTFFPNPLQIAEAKQGLESGSMYFDPTSGSYRNTSDGSVALTNTFLDRQNMGNVYHTSGVYMDKYQDLNYFIAAGWSHTDPSGVDELGISLLSDFWQEPESKDGYSVYVGGRYDIPNMPLKIGAEYNYGSKNWLGFSPGSDDVYTSKLYTRGSVYEVYGIYDIPAGDPISKYGKAFIRLGYQHYDYDYTYSGMWLGTPTDIKDIKNDPLYGQFYAPTDEIDQVYLTLEAYF